MSRKKWVLLAFLWALFAGLLAYGVWQGDALFVRQNAENFCFS